MDPAVVAALVAAGASLAVALSTAIWTSYDNRQARELQRKLSGEQQAAQRELADRQEASQRALAALSSQLAQKARQEEQRTEAQVVLNRYREPLLEEANYLGNRIDNIQHRGFFYYLDGDRGTLAILSTLFRIARYFGIREVIYAEVNHLKFERDEETRDVERLLSEIQRTFSSDRFDYSEDSSPATSRFMLWVEQQQAIGELSVHRDSNGTPHLIGYATFAESFSSRYAPWFKDFASDLRSGSAPTSKRLAMLQGLLAQLVCRLDHEQRFTSPKPKDSNWITRTTRPQPEP